MFAKFVLEQSLIHFPVKWYFYVSIYPAASLRDLESWKQSVREQQFIQNWDQQNVRKAMVTHRLQAYKRNAFIIKLPGEVCILSMALKKQTAWKDPPSYHFLKLLLKNITTICKLKSQQLPNIKYIIKQQTLWYM